MIGCIKHEIYSLIFNITSSPNQVILEINNIFNL